MFNGFNINKLKPNLKMAVKRINLIKNKKTNSIKIQIKEVAVLLQEGKEEKARIRVEGILREDYTIEAYEILELLCDLIAERAALIKSEKECPYDMKESICTLIWAASRTEIPELNEVKKQFSKKYGSNFIEAACHNMNGCVNEKVQKKLHVQPPSAYLVINYMKKIAKSNNINWEPDKSIATIDLTAPMIAPTGNSIHKTIVETTTKYNTKTSHPNITEIPIALGKPPSIFPNIPTTKPEEAFEKVNDTNIENASTNKNDVPDFDQLSARFEKLRKK